MTAEKLKTTVVSEFLEDQYKNKTFQSSFETYEDFEKVMADAVKSCKHCGLIAWKGCELPCDCQYERILKHKPLL